MRLLGAPVVADAARRVVERSGRFLRVRRLITWASGRLTAATIVHTRADLALLPRSVRERAVVVAHGEYGGLTHVDGAARRDASRAALGIAADVPVQRCCSGSCERTRALAT